MGKAKSIVLVVMIVLLIGGFYFYISNFKESNKETVVTEVQDVLLRNLDTNYPPTPRELLKYYSDVIKCAYNEKYTSEQFEQMADKLLELYDSELAENNPRDQYIKELQKAVEEFHNSGYSIVSYTTSSSTDVNEYIDQGRQCASLYCTYSIKRGTDYVSSKQIFILRKDAETGHWKILGFDIIEPQE